MPAPLFREVEVSPPFFDLDPMGVVWHGNYVRYFELARSALLTSLGYDYEQMAASGYAWPVVDMRIKFVRTLGLKHPVRVRATIVEWENRLKIDYVIRDAATGAKLTTGYTIQVAVEMKTGEMQYVSPQVLTDALGVTP
jgi:acyl-CoA thioester hydrolase